MRAGKHRVGFLIHEIVHGLIQLLGIMRPIEDLNGSWSRKFNPSSLDLSHFSRERNRVPDDDNVECRVLATRTGYCLYRAWNKEYLSFTGETGCKDRPTCSFGDRRSIVYSRFTLGYLGSVDICQSGFTGEYCWKATTTITGSWLCACRLYLQGSHYKCINQKAAWVGSYCLNCTLMQLFEIAQ